MNKIAFLPAVSVFALAAGFTSVTFAQACNPDGGNCRNIKVTVNGYRGATVRHRNGYYATPTARLKAPSEELARNTHAAPAR